MTRNAGTKRPAYGWCYLLPEVAAPIGGGLIKIGQASTWAAVSVGLAPYMIIAAMYTIFMLEHVPATICYLCSDRERQDAIDRLITTSANAIVALLTLTPADSSANRGAQADKLRLRALNGGSAEASEQDA
jgi:hypothetical protein